MKLTWNFADKVIAELPKGAGRLDIHHTRPMIEGREHGKPVFTLTTRRLTLHTPETAEIDLHGIASASSDGPFLRIQYEDGHETQVHATRHAAQIADLLNGLLEPEDPLLSALGEEAETGDTRAMERLAKIYEHREDANKARLWNERANVKAAPRPRAEHKDQEAANRQAGLDYQEEEAASAIDRLSGNALWLASRGFSQVNDFKSEWKYLQRAAELSHPDAHYQMGAYLASGLHEVPVDEKAAFRHMKEAAELGNSQAPYYLGSWYRMGFGTETDLEAADQWLSRDPSVKALIQRMLVQEEAGNREKAESFAREAMARTTSQKTRDMLQKKIDGWNTPSREPAYLEAARTYDRREAESVPKAVSAKDMMDAARGYEEVGDYAGERHALEEAARLMHPEANYKLGAYLASGMHENEKDEPAAFRWMMHAADLGHPLAPYYVGLWYASGTGIKKDLEQAAFWLAKDPSDKAKVQLALVKKSLGQTEEAIRLMEAVKQEAGIKATRELAQKKLAAWQGETEAGRKEARKALRIAHGLSDAGQYDLAAEFFEQAAGGGSSEARYQLALLYLKGQGVEADPAKARQLLEQTKDTQPESLYYLTYLEKDPNRQKDYARAYLASNPEKTRREQVEQLLGLKDPAPKQMAPARAPETEVAPAEPEKERKTPDPQAGPEIPEAASEAEKDAARLRRIGIARIQAGDQSGTEYLRQAADLGDTDACLLLGEAMLETDPAQGVAYLRTAADAGIGDGYALLGYAYMNGLGVPREPLRAQYLLQEALKRGSRIAQKWTRGL